MRMCVCVFVRVYFSKCVSIHVFMFIYTLVSKGWGQGSDGNRKCLFLNVRSVLRHDALPFSRTPAANAHTRTHRMVLLPTRSATVAADLD